MADDRSPILGGAWALWVQPDGPNTQPEYLGCHDLGDIEQDEGDITLLYCPSSERANKWDTVGSFQGEPSPATFEVTTTVKRQRDVIDKIRCPVPFYALSVECGRKDVFGNWDDTAIMLHPSTRTSRAWQNLAKRVPGDQNESLKVMGFSAEDVIEVWMPDVGQQSIAENAGITDIAFCNSEKCADACGNAEALCESGLVVTEAGSGSPTAEADVWHTSDEGITWTLTTLGEANSPFGNGEDGASVVCFEVDKDTTRYLVARGTADGSNPAEVAYRDATSGTWTTVNVGSVNGQYALGPQALFALDFQHIWLVTSGGYVYFSSDGGATWTAQESGTLTAQDLYAIHGSGPNDLFVGGATDTVLKSNDGGGSWATGTATGGGGTNQRVHTISKNLAWIGDNGGNLYFTLDAAVTWTARTGWTGAGTGEIKGIEFANDLVGWMLHNNATPVGTFFYTIDGGFSWRALSTQTNTGLNSLYVCGPTSAYAVGEAGVILKATVA